MQQRLSDTNELTALTAQLPCALTLCKQLCSQISTDWAGAVCCSIVTYVLKDKDGSKFNMLGVFFLRKHRFMDSSIELTSGILQLHTLST